MLVTTARIGASFRNDPSLSSLSTTRWSPCPHARVRSAQHGSATADHHGRIQTRMDQDGRHHGRGGGFSVAAGDGDAELQAHQLGQQLAARNHGKTQAAGFDNFGIVGADGGADHHGIRADHICCGVTFVNDSAHAPQDAR